MEISWGYIFKMKRSCRNSFFFLFFKFQNHGEIFNEMKAVEQLFQYLDKYKDKVGSPWKISDAYAKFLLNAIDI